MSLPKNLGRAKLMFPTADLHSVLGVSESMDRHEREDRRKQMDEVELDPYDDMRNIGKRVKRRGN
jgi:hypothetical protein